MTSLAAVLSIALAAGEAPSLVVPYQSLGVDGATVSAITSGFRQAAVRPGLFALPATESEKMERTAVACGEDAPCLATVGQRSSARWVLAFGVGKVGSSLLINALFIDVKEGKELARGSRRVPEGMAEWALVTRSLADEVVKLPAEPVVVQVPVMVEKAEKSHKFRPWAFASLGVAAAFAVAATAIGLVAWGNYNSLKEAKPGNYDALVKNQRLLNNGGDGCLIVAAVTGATSLLFFILDWVEKPVAPTSAEVVR